MKHSAGSCCGCNYAPPELIQIRQALATCASTESNLSAHTLPHSPWYKISTRPLTPDAVILSPSETKLPGVTTKRTPGMVVVVVVVVYVVSLPFPVSSLTMLLFPPVALLSSANLGVWHALCWNWWPRQCAALRRCTFFTKIGGLVLNACAHSPGRSRPHDTRPRLSDAPPLRHEPPAPRAKCARPPKRGGGGGHAAARQVAPSS